MYLYLFIYGLWTCRQKTVSIKQTIQLCIVGRNARNAALQCGPNSIRQAAGDFRAGVIRPFRHLDMRGDFEAVETESHVEIVWYQADIDADDIIRFKWRDLTRRCKFGTKPGDSPGTFIAYTLVLL